MTNFFFAFFVSSFVFCRFFFYSCKFFDFFEKWPLCEIWVQKAPPLHHKAINKTEGLRLSLA